MPGLGSGLDFLPLTETCGLLVRALRAGAARGEQMSGEYKIASGEYKVASGEYKIASDEYKLAPDGTATGTGSLGTDHTGRRRGPRGRCTPGQAAAGGPARRPLALRASQAARG